MFGSARSRSVAAVIVACGVLAGPIAVVQASDAGIIATFRVANPHLNADETAVKKAVTKYRRNHRPKAVIAALRREVHDIRAVNARIKRDRPSTRKGRRGKADITRGLSLIARAYATLARDVHKAHSGHPVSPAAINATVASDQRGRSKLLAGLRLLGTQVTG